ncbi:MAG: hypothetical protein BWY06_03272 [Candidatus Latescibacteria bacterium ADurb.Bin168]|nr:MAG: hypothetical protein BWY06_03272 [Candidatus Latescibacteria bacterium ADurb.Bin168]
MPQGNQTTDNSGPHPRRGTHDEAGQQGSHDKQVRAGVTKIDSCPRARCRDHAEYEPELRPFPGAGVFVQEQGNKLSETQKQAGDHGDNCDMDEKLCEEEIVFRENGLNPVQYLVHGLFSRRWCRV